MPAVTGVCDHYAVARVALFLTQKSEVFMVVVFGRPAERAPRAGGEVDLALRMRRGRIVLGFGRSAAETGDMIQARQNSKYGQCL